MSFHHLVNTQYFSEAARDYVKNGGVYTRAPEGTRDYREYWDLQEERCLNGYRVGDLWITGRHYHYLNFTPILKVPDDQVALAFKEMMSRGKPSKLTMHKVMEFPKFWEIDYEWWRFKHLAWHGGQFMGIKSDGAKHICAVKSRGAGFSYKEAADGVYNYNFIPESKSYYFAGIEDYLTKDGILNKVQGMMDFINLNIPEWRQNRMKSNTIMKMKASYMDEAGQEKGNKAEILGVIVDDPNKTRGKRGIKITFEEAGSFKKLKQALAISKATVGDGAFKVGQISVFGTGGEEGPAIEGLEDIHSNPEIFDMMAFPNIWEEGAEGTECGYFVPAWRCNSLYMDPDGNVIADKAIAYETSERAKKKKSKDPKELDRRKAEFPNTPNEAFQRTGKNPFRVAEIDRQIRRIRNNKAIQALLRYGFLSRDEVKGIQFVIQPKEKAKPVEDYPHKQGDDLSGCVTVVERPWVGQTGHTPQGMYQVVFDPFYKEESEDLTSLFAVYVYKQFNPFSPVNEDLPVAWYVGRPEDLDDAYDNLFMLCEWYNSTVQGEIAGGGQGVLDYATRMKLLHLVEFEPEMVHNKELGANVRNRSYLMNMATERKRMGLTYFIDWHKQIRGLEAGGKPVLNIHRIYDIGLLLEMRKFDGKRNCDRISAGIISRFMSKERVAREVQKEEKNNDFYNRELFGVYAAGSQFVEQY